jgi:hypothetical protein
MTRPASTDSGVLILPRPETSALLHRKQNPAVDPARHSLFRDDRWDLTPGLFEAHAVTCRLNFLPVPAGFRDHAKHYIWQLINHQPLRRLRSTRGTRLALRSVSLTLPRITTFLAWLDTHRITSCDRVTIEDLDRYLADVITLEATTSMKSSLLVEVRRLWGLPRPVADRHAPARDGALARG